MKILKFNSKNLGLHQKIISWAGHFNILKVLRISTDLHITATIAIVIHPSTAMGIHTCIILIP